MKSPEKWIDGIAFASMLVVAAIDALREDYCAMSGFLCASLWVCVAAIRRMERDMWRRTYESAVGADEEGN